MRTALQARSVQFVEPGQQVFERAADADAEELGIAFTASAELLLEPAHRGTGERAATENETIARRFPDRHKR